MDNIMIQKISHYIIVLLLDDSLVYYDVFPEYMDTMNFKILFFYFTCLCHDLLFL